MSIVQISDHAVISVTGAEAESFLQSIVSLDLCLLEAGEVRPGALLSPQGKILFDFLISRTGVDGFRLDCRRAIVEDFVKRLMLYRLRVRVEIFVSDPISIGASWRTGTQRRDIDVSAEEKGLLDRRFPELLRVMRHYGGAFKADAPEDQWHCLRVMNGVAESGHDYALGGAFPHEILFDQNGGVGLRKGCYIGQEVVSRMHHRGTARRRLLIVHGEGPLPVSGTALCVDGRPIGTLGTVRGREGLAILRIDHAAQARKAGSPILAGSVSLDLTVPLYAKFLLDSEAGS